MDASSVRKNATEDRGRPEDVGTTDCTDGIARPDGFDDLEVKWESGAVVHDLLADCADICNKGPGPTLLFKAMTLDDTPVVSVPIGDDGVDQLLIQRGGKTDGECS